MMLRFSVLLFALVLSANLTSQVSVYQDDTLSLPHVAIVNDDNVEYYSDVQLINDSNGKFTVIDATLNNLVSVSGVEILILESFPVQVQALISGEKSVPCVELQPASVSRKDNTFTIVLAESQLGPAETCIAIVEPFETIVTLDVLGLPAGTYTVAVNDVETSFTLDADN